MVAWLGVQVGRQRAVAFALRAVAQCAVLFVYLLAGSGILSLAGSGKLQLVSARPPADMARRLVGDIVAGMAARRRTRQS